MTKLDAGRVNPSGHFIKGGADAVGKGASTSGGVLHAVGGKKKERNQSRRKRGGSRRRGLAVSLGAIASETYRKNNNEERKGAGGRSRTTNESRREPGADRKASVRKKEGISATLPTRKLRPA